MAEDESLQANDPLSREVLALRAQVAELQSDAARYEDTEGMSLAERVTP